MNNLKVLIHDRRLSALYVDFEPIKKTMEAILPEGTTVSHFNENAGFEKAFEDVGIPNVYVCGVVGSMYDDYVVTTVRHIAGAKNVHPEIKIIATPYGRDLERFLSLADATVPFEKKTDLVKTVGKFIGTKTGKKN